MVVRKILCADYTMHIGLHEFLDKINFGEGIVTLWFLYIQDRNDLDMSEHCGEIYTFSWLK